MLRNGLSLETELRIFNFGSSNTFLLSSSGLRILRYSIATAISVIFVMGCSIAVKAGERYDVKTGSSNVTSEISVGMLTPFSLHASRAPNAIRSPAVKIAVGGFGIFKRCFVSKYPLSENGNDFVQDSQHFEQYSNFHFETYLPFLSSRDAMHFLV